MRKVCLLGASGSIGKQTLDVIYHHPEDFELVGFSVGHRVNAINKILKRFKNIKAICVQEESSLPLFKQKYPHITFYHGDEGLLSLIDNCGAEMVVNALVGFVGLKPTLHTLEKNLILCLANKESLVVGGELVNEILVHGCGKLYPIDSEHSALLKCLLVKNKGVDKLMLTASGGAFRNLTREQLKTVTAEDALKHPTWKMGQKITIDCATMVNKAFEVIEAHYLYNYPASRIGITLHDESYIHSYVTYKDGTLRAEESKPDMRNPIRFALYECKIPFETVTAREIKDFKKYHFHAFDPKRYPMVQFSKTVINKKGTYGAAFNAANEVAVNYFLKGKIKFLDIEKIIASQMKNHVNILNPTYEQLYKVDTITREQTLKMIERKMNKQ